MEIFSCGMLNFSIFTGENIFLISERSNKIIPRSNDNLQVVIHSKNGWDPINIDDRHGYEEFILIADKLFHNDLRKLTFLGLSKTTSRDL